MAKSRRSGRLVGLRGLEIGFGGPLRPRKSREGLGEIMGRLWEGQGLWGYVAK